MYIIVGKLVSNLQNYNEVLSDAVEEYPFLQSTILKIVAIY